MQPPVQVGDDHGFPGGGRGSALLPRRAFEVIDRLGGAPEQQPRPHTAGEQHGNPGPGGEFRPFVVRAEADMAVGPERQEQRERQERRADQQPVPTDPAEQIVGEAQRGPGHAVGVHQPPRPDRDTERHRDVEDGVHRRRRPSPIGHVQPPFFFVFGPVGVAAGGIARKSPNTGKASRCSTGIQALVCWKTARVAVAMPQASRRGSGVPGGRRPAAGGRRSGPARRCGPCSASRFGRAGGYPSVAITRSDAA